MSCRPCPPNVDAPAGHGRVEKRRIIAEAFRPGVSAADVARSYGLIPSALFFRALDALAIDDGRSRARLAPDLLAAGDVQHVMQPVERSVVLPTLEVAVDRAARLRAGRSLGIGGSQPTGTRCSTHTSAR
jgi:transposase-like protein